MLAIKQFDDPVTIELCCGEGFNSRYFYAHECKYIYACDFDSAAIKEAKRKYFADNLEFAISDIREGIPDEINGMSPTNIIWDTAIEHFTPQEINEIMEKIKSVLSPQKGILSGHTVCEIGEKMIEQHEYEFKNMQDLRRFFLPYFKNVIVWETIYSDRHNLYFMASDGTLPFSENWEHWITK